MMIAKPGLLPKRPHFSSGPCAKRPGWSLKKLDLEALGRSHRAGIGKRKLKRVIDLMREVLEVPADYKIGIVPASDTGAFEMALWSMLGARGVDVISYESFGKGWLIDITKHLKIQDCRLFEAPYGELPDLKSVDTKLRDVVFSWNGTTSGVRVPDAAWIDASREGLTFCDATSGVFAQELDFAKLDVATFSWQKALGGEGAHGVLILSPRAVARLETYKPAWPLPKIFRLIKDGKLIEGIFEGETINTPSMLCVADYEDALSWAKELGGLPALIKRADGNFRVLSRWVKNTPWIDFLAVKPKMRSNTSVCLVFSDVSIKSRPEETQTAFVKRFCELLEKENAAFDIKHHRDAPLGLRIWCGCTVNRRDLATLLPWLEWAYETARAELKLAA
jgi:phosphoserine aminotransferase